MRREFELEKVGNMNILLLFVRENSDEFRSVKFTQIEMNGEEGNGKC